MKIEPTNKSGLGSEEVRNIFLTLFISLTKRGA